MLKQVLSDVTDDELAQFIHPPDPVRVGNPRNNVHDSNGRDQLNEQWGVFIFDRMVESQDSDKNRDDEPDSCR